MTKVFVLGGGWISGDGSGVLGQKPRFSAAGGLLCPDLTAILPELPQRFGRFDAYTKACFSAAVLALKDAGFVRREKKENIGLVVGSRTGVGDNDLAFFETTLEGGGTFSSPNLFSYTLPNVALGEIAVYFKLVGPSFCTGNDPSDPGTEALRAAAVMLADCLCPAALAGWVEVTDAPAGGKALKGAAIAVLSSGAAGAKMRLELGNTARFQDIFEG